MHTKARIFPFLYWILTQIRCNASSFSEYIPARLFAYHGKAFHKFTSKLKKTGNWNLFNWELFRAKVCKIIFGVHKQLYFLILRNLSATLIIMYIWQARKGYDAYQMHQRLLRLKPPCCYIFPCDVTLPIYINCSEFLMLNSRGHDRELLRSLLYISD